MIKAAFLDIDGTIRSLTTKIISESSISAIRQARRNGVKVFLSTSRAVQFINGLDGVEYDGLVCLTGAHCLDAEGHTIHADFFTRADAEGCVRYCEKNDMPLFFYGENDIWVRGLDRPESQAVLGLGGVQYPGFIDWKDGSEVPDILQVTAMVRAGQEEESIMSEMPDSHPERWYPSFTDILPNSASKGNGMIRVAKFYGIDMADTLAMGDGQNDISMLKAAGAGVAMGNANDIVKASADWVTSDVDGDGLFKAFKHYGII